MCDFAPRDGFPILPEAKLHAIIMGTGLIGSPVPTPKALPSPPGGRGQGASLVASGDAPVRSFNLDACFKMGEGR